VANTGVHAFRFTPTEVPEQSTLLLDDHDGITGLITTDNAAEKLCTTGLRTVADESIEAVGTASGMTCQLDIEVDVGKKGGLYFACRDPPVVS
jgi:hypothetical protein